MSVNCNILIGFTSFEEIHMVGLTVDIDGFDLSPNRPPAPHIKCRPTMFEVKLHIKVSQN